VSVWFFYGEISFATAISGCFGKLGSVTTDIVTPLVFRGTESISWTFWIAVFVNVGAFLFILVLNLIDKVNEKRRKEIRYIRKTKQLVDKINSSFSVRSKSGNYPNNMEKSLNLSHLSTAQ
jgi:nitrate/nitrite transporter NarK